MFADKEFKMGLILPNKQAPVIVHASYSLCCRVVELVLSGAAEAGLNSSVLPQPLDDPGQLAGHETLLC